MSWGVATQNGVSVSLASIVSLSAGVTEFSPADLFTGGTVGAWYDPSDYSTLFQDSAGTTPVTVVEQPVGLMLDKSQGLVLGSELVTNGDFSGGTTGWTAGNSAVFSVTSGVATIQNGAAAVGNANQSFTTVVGRWYVATATFSSPAGGSTGGQIYIGTSAGTFGVAFNSVATGTVSLRFAATATTTFISLVAGTATNGASIQADNVSVKELPGNHASQATSTSRPVLRARYNLLTYSEDFSNAIWQVASSGGGVNGVKTPNFGVAPDGTTTACRIQLDVTPGLVNAQSQVYQTFTSFAANETYSAWVKTNDGSTKTIRAFTAGTVTPTTITVTGTWTRFEAVRSATTPNDNFQFLLIKGSTSDTADLLVWHPDVRLSSTSASMPNYQRIAAATDYATAGFLPYLAFDGTDDSFGTNSINFSATDKMSVCAGVTKLSDAASAIVVELSANAVLNAGAFNIQAPATGGNAEYRYGEGGTAFRTALVSGYSAPTTNVISGIGNVSAPSAAIRVDGVTKTTDTVSQGTGNFGNWPLFIGRRNNSLLPFNGRIYQMVICGKTLSASELASTEAYVATKTGVTL